MRLDPNLFFSGRLIHYDAERERGLFEMVDPATGLYVMCWARTQYTRAKHYHTETRHRPGCSGFASPDAKPPYLLGKLLLRCNCPVDTEFTGYVWCITPKHLTVEVGGQPVHHRQACEGWNEEGPQRKRSGRLKAPRFNPY